MQGEWQTAERPPARIVPMLAWVYIASESSNPGIPCRFGGDGTAWRERRAPESARPLCSFSQRRHKVKRANPLPLAAPGAQKTTVALGQCSILIRPSLATDSIRVGARRTSSFTGPINPDARNGASAR
jgi:hypothetical protein